MRKVLAILVVVAALAGGVAGYSVLTAPPAIADPSCTGC